MRDIRLVFSLRGEEISRDRERDGDDEGDEDGVTAQGRDLSANAQPDRRWSLIYEPVSHDVIVYKCCWGE